MTSKILEIQDLTVSFDGFRALNHLTFSMNPGELRVIIGPNGAGKTTFLDVITGKVQPTEGRVLFQGKDIRKIPEYRIARLGVGRKFQTPRVYLNLTVAENLDLAVNRKKSVWGTLMGQATGAEQRSVGGLLETIGLTPKAHLAAALLSHGEKQRLEIGMLVAQSPTLLLVDEPVAGLTDEETENVGDLLLALAESHSIIVIEHDMEFVRQIARKVTVLHQGSVLCEGNMDQIQNDPKVIEVYLGEAPSLSPQQFKILRTVAAVAAADGKISETEMAIILDNLSQVFKGSGSDPQHLRQELQDYLLQGVEVDFANLTEEIPKQEDRELVLRLSQEIVAVHRQEPEPFWEWQAYQELLRGLNLPITAISVDEDGD
ncbi:high-affinity branched-chain amino acid transport ATP-binding protein [Synechocystis sp. PCC 6803]|uniref:High-affinity branched-chain amino acid transport ATP-binding protein n=1 Tax=Synechocystis sp. (strain ATCC 27184 / PCC 6803 / Kazusa) TaxID=1111708 RepID=Q55614_SYNY3|nr:MULTISPECIES: urea ABC transporter ATP-binding protein UrtD [unclassified Synechocystis]BAM54534.1 high-affinity branched-chain amino acidtransport ATP-binding protein [Synechocystis sp. PCC 6803] [Bacillus subtilis BEST7613]AGF52420.1 high-affinity branched-chain amino acid transport ATP-binding protein [Synechocystis sp. PCC 6803]ALJ68358.1 urea ABC transporter ATP-binding protein [Synechocystis sp. PCC 6803]AVP91339.1 urea ABC transporter ATP-binding protein UrtD [Synechocystis sp. IPPAS 